MKLNAFHFASEGNRCKIEREREKRKYTEQNLNKEKINK